MEHAEAKIREVVKSIEEKRVRGRDTEFKTLRVLRKRTPPQRSFRRTTRKDGLAQQLGCQSAAPRFVGRSERAQVKLESRSQAREEGTASRLIKEFIKLHLVIQDTILQIRNGILDCRS